MSELHWKTAITKIEPNKIFLRGYPLHELMGRITFSQAIYLALKGELPSEKVGKLIDAILVSSIDHGATPPSVLAARTVASTGADLNSAISAGILAISKYHGGAIEEAMRIFEEAVKRKEESGLSEEEVVTKMIKEKKEKGERISGFGHRIHTQDPRTKKLFSLAEELGFSGKYVSMAKAFEKGLEKILGKSLPINVDGAIAALLCELGIPKELGNSFFIMARVPGLIAHVYEEKTRMKPMRKIHPTDHEYDGPEERKL